MVIKKKKAKGAVIGKCRACKGTGQVPREVPFLANPNAPATRAGRMGMKACPNCQGSGITGAK